MFWGISFFVLSLRFFPIRFKSAKKKRKKTAHSLTAPQSVLWAIVVDGGGKKQMKENQTGQFFCFFFFCLLCEKILTYFLSVLYVQQVDICLEE